MKNINSGYLTLILLLTGGVLLTGCESGQNRKTNSTPDDQTGRMRGMMGQMMGGRLPPGISPEDLPEPESRGAKLTAKYCSSCHALPSPQMHAAADWPSVAERMFRRMEMMSGMMNRMSVEGPTEKQQGVIVEYLQAHALKTVKTEDLGPPASRGENLFRENCAQCHALPAPSQHTADEWPAVVARMQQNIQAMDREPMSAEEIRHITAYLQEQVGR
jgi:mono/diheme cytochrome c family protein